MTADGVERIWRSVRRLYRSGMHPAIALCVRREGQVVIDRAIGHARGNGPGDAEDEPKVAATPDTPFGIFSASKAITAMVVHLLDERDLLHVGDRVCEYIPEYRTHGKDAITIDHVLSHRAGVPNLPAELLDLDNIERPRLHARRPVRRAAALAPGPAARLPRDLRRLHHRRDRPAGHRQGHPRGAGGRDPRPARLPLGQLRRAPRPTSTRSARSYVTGPPVLPPISTVLTRALGVPIGRDRAVSNDPRFLTAIVPAANVVTTANELSRFFELLRAGGELDGVRIIEPRTIRRAIVEHSYRELDLTLGAPLRHSLGFMLGARWLSLYGPDTEMAFGHLGFTNMLGWADPERAISGALLTSGKPILYPELTDLWALMRRIGAQAPKVERSALAFEPATGPAR